MQGVWEYRRSAVVDDGHGASGDIHNSPGEKWRNPLVSLSMSAEAATAIESQVRELIRKRGVDPVRDVGAVRTMVDDALASWEQRALAGSVAPYEDRFTVAKSVLDNVAGRGPLQQYLDDPEIEEVWINDPAQVLAIGTTWTYSLPSRLVSLHQR